jgi:hypothetical protein
MGFASIFRFALSCAVAWLLLATSSRSIAEAPRAADEGSRAELTGDSRSGGAANRNSPSDQLPARVDLREWTKRHSAARTSLPGWTCRDAGDQVGVPAAPGLVCERADKENLVTHARVYRLEKRRLRIVWQGFTQAGWEDPSNTPRSGGRR